MACAARHSWMVQHADQQSVVSVCVCARGNVPSPDVHIVHAESSTFYTHKFTEQNHPKRQLYGSCSAHRTALRINADPHTARTVNCFRVLVHARCMPIIKSCHAKFSRARAPSLSMCSRWLLAHLIPRCGKTINCARFCACMLSH